MWLLKYLRMSTISMRRAVAALLQCLPCFGAHNHFQEMEMVKGSSDFFGLNHYSTDFVSQGELLGDKWFERNGFGTRVCVPRIGCPRMLCSLISEVPFVASMWHRVKRERQHMKSQTSQ